MNHCEEYLELISAAIDGALSPAEQEKLNAHLDVCPHCRILYDELEELHSTLAELPAPPVPADLTGRIMAAVERDNVTVLPVKKRSPIRWQRWTAAAAMFAVILAGAWSLSRSDPGGLKQDLPDAASLESLLLADASSDDKQEEIAPMLGAAAVTEGADDTRDVDASAKAAPEGDPSTGILKTSSVSVPGRVSAPAATPVPAPEPTSSPVSNELPQATGDPEQTYSQVIPRIAVSSVPSPSPEATGDEAPEVPPLTLTSLPSIDEVEDPEIDGTGPAEVPSLTPEEALDRLADHLWPEGLPEGMARMDGEGLCGYETPLVTLGEDSRQQASTRLEYIDLTTNGKYHEFWLYSFLLDDPETGLAHSSTLNFFAVPLNGGDILTQRIETDGSDEGMEAYLAAMDAYHKAISE